MKRTNFIPEITTTPIVAVVMLFLFCTGSSVWAEDDTTCDRILLGSCRMGELARLLDKIYAGDESFKSRRDARRTVDEIEFWIFEKARDACRETKEIRTLAQQLDKSAALLRTEDPTTLSSANDLRKNLDQQSVSSRSQDMQDLAKLKELLGFDPCKKRLYDDYRSYNGWGFQFDTGLDYVTVKEVFQEGFPSLDVMVYRDFRATNQWRWMPQFYIHSGLTNAGEALAVINGKPDEPADPMEPADGKEPTDEGTMESEVEPALHADIALFFPLLRFGDGKVEKSRDGKYRINRGRKLRDQVGFYLEGGFVDVDTEPNTRSRYYAGLRWAFNYQWYFDALVGRTEGLESDRLELRGQFPIIPASNNSRVYLGMIANLGFNKPEDSMEEDVVTVFVKWNIDVKGFFEKLSSGS